MTRDATSEEKLLKLIRQKKKPGHSNNGQSAHDGASTKQGKAKKKRTHSFRKISFIFFFLSFGCVVYIAVNTLQTNNKNEVPLGGGVDVRRMNRVNRIAKKVSLPKAKPFHFYEQRFQKRDIFELPGMKVKSKSNILDNIGADLSKRIKIVGIVIDQDSKVIIEDIKTGKTFFMSEGESVGSAVIEKIQDDKVIFKYNNKEVELSP